MFVRLALIAGEFVAVAQDFFHLSKNPARTQFCTNPHIQLRWNLQWCDWVGFPRGVAVRPGRSHCGSILVGMPSAYFNLDSRTTPRLSPPHKSAGATSAESASGNTVVKLGRFPVDATGAILAGVGGHDGGSGS